MGRIGAFPVCEQARADRSCFQVGEVQARLPRWLGEIGHAHQIVAPYSGADPLYLTGRDIKDTAFVRCRGGSTRRNGNRLFGKCPTDRKSVVSGKSVSVSVYLGGPLIIKNKKRKR